MTKLMDYTISAQPIRIAELMVDPSRLRIAGVYILQIGHLPGRKLRRSRVGFDHWALAYIAGGRGHLRIDDGPEQTIGPGSIFFVYPGAEFSYGPDEGGTWEEYYVRFEGPRVQEWIGSGLVGGGPSEHVPHEERYETKFAAMLTLLESGLAEQADQASLLLESLLLELAWARSTHTARTASRTGTAYKVLEDLSTRLYEPIDAEAIARANHMSVPTLRRLVSKQTGYSLHEYMHRLKIAEAKKLLLGSDIPVKQCARQLGYDDPLYFSRLFKKLAGVSASDFRVNV